MKILIDNRTDLNFEEVGIIIADIQEREKNTTQYIGKWKAYQLELRNGKNIGIETLVMKRYFKILIMEREENKE